MNDAITAVQAELARAGEDTRRLELLARLEKRRITPDMNLPPMEFLFRMFCKPCFPRGELVAVAGKAKSGKTFISSVLMSLCFRDEVLSIQRLGKEPLRVLWFDTEQSEESTQDILRNRIIPMITGRAYSPDSPDLCSQSSDLNPDGFHVFNLRPDFWQERMPMLEAAMHEYTPDLVILDGIRDLVNDINDGVMAQNVIERLMHLASELRCCIVCVLHQNKSLEDKNLRGWIGTELKNKAFEVYECSKDSDRIFTWKQTDTRKYDIVDKLKYAVGTDGIPYLCTVESLFSQQQKLPSGTAGGRPAINPKYLLTYEGQTPVMRIRELFTDAFRPGETKSAAALMATVMHMANMTSMGFYDRCRKRALQMDVIAMTQEGDKTLYSCPAKPAVSKAAEPMPQEAELFPAYGTDVF